MRTDNKLERVISKCPFRYCNLKSESYLEEFHGEEVDYYFLLDQNILNTVMEVVEYEEQQEEQKILKDRGNFFINGRRGSFEK